MTNVTIDAGTLTANREERIVSGLLLPYGEDCRSNLGKFRFDAGVVQVPRDLTGMSLNVEHERERVIGGPVTLAETPAGIVATFKMAQTPEGDAALEDIAAGRRRHLSAEVAGVKIKDGKGIAGRLFAAALVAKPAFPSATLLAAEDTDEEPVVTEAHEEETFTDENGVTWTRVVDTEVETEGNKTTTTTTVIEETEEPEAPAEEEEEPAVATAPNTLTAAKADTTKLEVKDREIDLSTIYASIAGAKAGDRQAAETLMAALSDIKMSGTGALPGTGVLQPNWVGPVWQGKTYERKYINLAKLGTEIGIAGKKGFKINRGTAASPKTMLGGDWAGNKVEVPTGQAHTSTIESSLRRFAFAADIAREFYDLPGGQEVVEAFIRLIVEDYAVWSDEKALADIVSTAGTAVAPGTYPTEYSGALGQLIQGILAVKRAKDVPSYAIVNQTAYEELLFTPKDLVPEFISFAFSTELTGSADGGSVTVVEAPDDSFTGLAEGEPAVLVGAKNAIEFDEVGATPIQIDALEIAKGGVDRAVHGYLQTFVVRPEAVVLVGTAAAV